MDICCSAISETKDMLAQNQRSVFTLVKHKNNARLFNMIGLLICICVNKAQQIKHISDAHLVNSVNNCWDLETVLHLCDWPNKASLKSCSGSSEKIENINLYYKKKGICQS